jgi:uncharacterized protein (UPF0332 family)
LTDAKTPEAYLAKAERGSASAQLLLNGDDADGACNRAYYAMFDAAHAALAATHIGADAEPKTHRGLIAAFGKHLVMDFQLDAELGRVLNQVQRLRLLADYTGDLIAPADAKWSVERAAVFVAAMRMFVDARTT